MMLVARALWYLESHMAGELTLERLALDLGVSPFHLARAFANRTGVPVMRYVWRRRLARAAADLANGEGSVLQAALAAGYASHEAFTRAFRAEFGLTPRQLTSARLAELNPMQPMKGPERMDPRLKAPKLEKMPERIIAGPSRRYDMQSRVNIPAQWAAYNSEGVAAAGAVPDAWYGAIHDFAEDGTFGYLCGQEVRSARGQPAGFATVAVPAGTYARFHSPEHISTMGDAWNEIYEYWLTRPDYSPLPGTSLEYYSPAFDGRTGNGGYEIWIRVRDAQAVRPDQEPSA